MELFEALVSSHQYYHLEHLKLHEIILDVKLAVCESPVVGGEDGDAGPRL